MGPLETPVHPVQFLVEPGRNPGKLPSDLSMDGTLVGQASRLPPGGVSPRIHRGRDARAGSRDGWPPLPSGEFMAPMQTP